MTVADAANEEWRPVLGYEGYYEVSSRGRVRSLPRKVATSRGARVSPGRTLKTPTSTGGYLRVDLSRDGISKSRSVHVLVLEAFTGPRPSRGHDACHWDGDPSNNNIENLRWDTKSANMADKMRHGRDFRKNKTQCKRGHLLREPNLVPSRLRIGQRSCRACSMARSVIRRHGGDFQAISDAKYQQIMKNLMMGVIA